MCDSETGNVLLTSLATYSVIYHVVIEHGCRKTCDFHVYFIIMAGPGRWLFLEPGPSD